MKLKLMPFLSRVKTSKLRSWALVFLVLGGGLSQPAEARRMSSRTGFGLTLHPLNSTPAISVRHHLSDHQAAVALLGFDTSSATKVLVVGGKFYQAAHLEENLNFYVGLGGFVLSYLASGTTAATGIEVEALFGAEFFLSGLPNLGFQFETGIAMRTPGGVTFSTLLGGALHYYF